MKIRTSLICLLVIIINLNLKPQQKSGGITNEMLNEIKKSFYSHKIEGIGNAISNNEIKKLAYNRRNVNANDTYFSNRIKSKGITDQKSSGRCWLFCSLNVIRNKVITKNNLGEFQFSQNYAFFWDQLEKANLFLQNIIENKDKPLDDKKVEWLFKNPIGDGGQWTGLANISYKYGLVPSDVMPETKNSESTNVMSSILANKLREDGLTLRDMYSKGQEVETLQKQKVEMLADIYKILVYCLGEPPTEFNWRYKDATGKLSDIKKYTPLSFFKEFVNIDLSSFVMLMNDPSRPYYKLYEVEYDQHTFDGDNWKYINLPIDVIKEISKNSILDSNALYFSCDVGKQLYSEKGILDVNNYDYEDLFGIKFGMDKKQRIQTFESGSSHGMTLIGVDLDINNKPIKWLLENSWGNVGFEGHLIMTDKWFEEYMFRLVVNKKYVPVDVLKVLEQKPTLLPPWDPMFLPEE